MLKQWRGDRRMCEFCENEKRIENGYTIGNCHIENEIQEKLSKFIPELLKGKHIEIHLAKGNEVKIFSVDKKIVK